MNSTTTAMISDSFFPADTELFDQCEMAELSPLIAIDFAAITTSKSLIAVTASHLHLPYTHLIPLLYASMVAIGSIIYAALFKPKPPALPAPPAPCSKGYQLHFVGIQRPQTFTKSTYKLLANVDAEDTLISLRTELNATDTVSDLKQIVKKTYNISDEHDIMILFSHHFLTETQAELQSVGITNNSLLTIAICANHNEVIPPPIEPAPEPTPTPPPRIVEYRSEYETDSDYPDDVNAAFGNYDSDYESTPEPIEPVKDVNELFGMFKKYETDSEDDEPAPTPSPTPPPPTWPRPGFDIIMQEDNVMVHRMPCGHEMNKDSLLSYALSTFSDHNNLHLCCPHAHNKKADQLCGARWEYNQITDILQYPEEEDTCCAHEHKHHDHVDDEQWMEYAKVELLSARNMIQKKCDVQKCPRCKSLYFKNFDANKTKLEDIKTKDMIETEFRFECILCPKGTEQITELVPNPDFGKNGKKPEPVPGIHDEDLIEEDIDALAVNAVFGGADNDEDSDYDTEDEEEEDNRDSLLAVQHMFDDDEPEFLEEESTKYLNEFCFCCGEQWTSSHVCDASFKKDLVQILAMAETKQIGEVHDVPSIRSCPRCCQLIFHTEACKHMNCRGCHLDFCFVCLKPTKDGAWQCGSHCDKCPVHPPQGMHDLPDTVVITKKAFQLY